ncbi:MAG TPA: hypothetical protein VF665_07770 [Longimicrobium sp.]|jgi:hypothetical protein|uniref:hypothetical protein n=1 Tax=Longimicrobium sp. TaxID=2029185 RepID=UPI002EDA29BB
MTNHPSFTAEQAARAFAQALGGTRIPLFDGVPDASLRRSPMGGFIIPAVAVRLEGPACAPEPVARAAMPGRRPAARRTRRLVGRARLEAE